MKMKYIMLVLIMIFLSACGQKESFPDLLDYIKKLDAKNGITPTKPFVLTQPKAITYQKQIERSPFDDANVADNSKVVGNSPINAYSLNLLKFVGTISQNNKLTAYIMTPDNKVYQVTIGDTIGNHSGRIVKISPNEVVVVEQASDEGNQSAERMVTLQLKEEN